jgi:hypothetical protein
MKEVNGRLSPVINSVLEGKNPLYLSIPTVKKIKTARNFSQNSGGQKVNFVRSVKSRQMFGSDSRNPLK